MPANGFGTVEDDREELALMEKIAGDIRAANSKSKEVPSRKDGDTFSWRGTGDAKSRTGVVIDRRRFNTWNRPAE